jgi:anti-anti-sigma factor
MGESLRPDASSSSELLHIDVHADDPPRAVLVLRGELDHTSAADVRRAVEAAARDGHDDIVLDLSALSFMDAGGLKLLFGLRDRAAGARCSMADGSPAVSRLLELVPGQGPLPRADARPTSMAE